MPTFQPPKRNSAYVFYISLVSQASTKTFQANPTLAAGDVKLAIDDAAPANIVSPPVVDADFTKRVKVSLSAAEMNGDRVTVIFSDVAGAEWCDLTVDIATSTTQFNDLATQASVDAIEGATPAEVWAYAPRTLTMTATQVAASITGKDLVIIKAVTFAATLTGITLPVGWDKLYFTAKQTPNYPDSTALIQLVLSNPGLPGDGLLVINQKVATPANGNLVVAGSAVTITLTDDATALLQSGDSAPYDLKVVVDGASVLLTTGKATIAGTPTASI
jgi:hypothetical protein